VLGEKRLHESQPRSPEVHEASAKQGDLVRESARLEAEIERLKKAKETLEKEVGQLEGQQPKSPASGQ
jgi:cell division protein FtsB